MLVVIRNLKLVKRKRLKIKVSKDVDDLNLIKSCENEQ